MKTVSLSKHLGVKRDILEEIGVFDATLGIDTELFVDPKLLVNSQIPEFTKSREKILRYFTQLLRVHKQSLKYLDCVTRQEKCWQFRNQKVYR